MPVVDVDPDELRTLVDTDRSDEELRADLFALGLEFEGTTEEGDFQLEFAPDRLDRLSVEGIARSLRYQYGTDRGVYVPGANDAEWTIVVDGPPAERPYVTGAIVRGLDLDDRALDSLIQLQEKLHATMGRQRAKGAIGVHDLTMLKGAAATGGAEKSIRYTSVDPDEEPFVPLESDEGMTPREVTERHHMGREYADLVADMDEYPAIYDDVGLFSFPPVINGRRTEVTTDSRDLLIELTGTDQWTIDHMCTIVCYALAARGGRLERVEVAYADETPGEYAGQTLERPDLGTKTKTVTHDRVESILGVDLESETVADCLERAGLSVSDEIAGQPAGQDGTYEVEIPPYRVDVLHPMDVVDDIGRAYGFNELEPRYPDVSTVGGRHEDTRLEDAARDTLTGMGFEGLLNFYMTNGAENFTRMGLDGGAESDTDLVGGGDLVPDLQALVRELDLSDRVRFVDPVPQAEIPGLLAEATIGLAPLVDDPELAYAMPTKLYEYLGCGLPVVTTGRGELRRFVEAADGGIHTDGEPEALASAFERVLTDDERRREFGASGRAFVEREYDHREIADRFGATLRELTETRQSPRERDGTIGADPTPLADETGLPATDGRGDGDE